MKSLFRFIILFSLPALLGGANVQTAWTQQDGMTLCILPLTHADANNLVAVLSPLLSPSGSITAYSPTNTLIIKDRASVVRMLVKAIKGKPNLTQCTNWPHAEDNK